MPTNNPEATPMNEWALEGCPVRQADGTTVRETVHLHKVVRGETPNDSLHWVTIIGYVPRTEEFVRVVVFDPVWEIVKEGDNEYQRI